MSTECKVISTAHALACLLLAAFLALLAGGCKTDDGMPIQCADIKISHPADISPLLATNLFLDIGDQLDCRTYPHAYPLDPANPAKLEYAASYTLKGASTVSLVLNLDGKHDIFHADVDLDPASVAALQKVMKLCEQFLDERQIKYTVHSYTSHLYMIPSAGSSAITLENPAISAN